MAVQSEVKTLWETASSQKTDTIRSNHAKNETSAGASPRGCQECKKKREGDRCSHCYFCGGSNQYCHARYPHRAGSSHTRERKVPPVYGCLKFDCHMELLQCSACQSVCYFFVQCQKAHWPKHKVLCKAIKELSVKGACKEKVLGNTQEENMFASHLTPRQQECIAKLVGGNVWCNAT